MKSETEAQKKRPAMLNRLSRPTKPTAATGADAALEQVLDHRRGLLQDADAGGDVGAQHDPQQPELRRPPRRAHVDIVRADQRGLLSSARQPAGFQSGAGRGS